MEKSSVVSINISQKKGTKKKAVNSALCLENYGLANDAHAGVGLRQVSLLAQESIDKMRAKGLQVKAGDFAENITTAGINLLNYPLGAKFKIGEAILEISQIGKKCPKPCAIYYQAGDCVMPKEGIFAQVKKGGEIKIGDKIKEITGDTLQS